jgi:hypothetical protein
MEEDCGGGQGLTKGCGAKGRRGIQEYLLIQGFYGIEVGP